MRIFGDLDRNEGHGSNDLSGSRAAGGNGSHKEESSSHASGGEPAIKDGQAVEPREQMGFEAQESEKGQSNAFAGGSPLAGPTVHPRGGGQSGKRVSDRIGEQRLELAGDINTRAQLSSRRSNGGLWFALMVLVLAVVGASAYLYLSLRENNINLSQVPDLLQSITTLDGRMDATEAKLRDLAANWDGLTNHLAELDGKVDSSLRATRNQMRELVGQAAGRLQAEMDQQGRVVDARLNKVESMQRQDRAQLAQLNDQLQGQVSSLREQLTATQESTGRDLANLQGQVSEDQSNLHTLAQRLHRDKVTFEIVKDSHTELAPGVTLTVLNTGVSYQRFRGYISLTNEGKTLWLNNLNAKEAVDLYAQQYSHPYSLIVATVSKDGVVGYLPLPAGA
ncbi:MAG: hypothetical protein ABSC21_11195 [Terriglobia bacterium]